MEDSHRNGQDYGDTAINHQALGMKPPPFSRKHRTDHGSDESSVEDTDNVKNEKETTLEDTNKSEDNDDNSDIDDSSDSEDNETSENNESQ